MVPLLQVAQYPRVFIHDPVLYLGPRLAYLRAYKPGGAGGQQAFVAAHADGWELPMHCTGQFVSQLVPPNRIPAPFC